MLHLFHLISKDLYTNYLLIIVKGWKKGKSLLLHIGLPLIFLFTLSPSFIKLNILFVILLFYVIIMQQVFV